MLPDRSLLMGQKLLENAKIEKLKRDILGHFQTLCTMLLFTAKIWKYLTQPRNI